MNSGVRQRDRDQKILSTRSDKTIGRYRHASLGAFSRAGQGETKIMTLTQRTSLSNSRSTLSEFFSAANVDALNAALLERGIAAESVVAILPVPAVTVAYSSTPPQYQVIYRTHAGEG